MSNTPRWTIKVATFSRKTGRKGWHLARRGKGSRVLSWTDRVDAIAEARRAYGYDEGHAITVLAQVRP